jgi:hypothetical protein
VVSLTARAKVRSVVQPVLGERGVEALRKAEKDLRRRRARRARLRAGIRDLKQELARYDAVPPAARQGGKAAAKQAEVDKHADDLSWLAKHFRTDKWGAHRYTPHYQHHFAHLRDKPINILEIGIGVDFKARTAGASLRMWEQYFPHANIYGLDIEDRSSLEGGRIHIYQGDQSDPDLLRRIVSDAGRLDVIIDDGSHRPAHVLATFEVLFPLLADDGIYVVEDIQTSYWPEWGGQEDIADQTTSMAMLKRLADGLNYEEFVVEPYEPSYTDLHVVGVHFYHNLVFIQKGVNEEGTSKRRILKARYANAAG